MFDKSLTIPIGSDHAGYDMKRYLIEKLTKAGYHFYDCGTYNNVSVDYPDFIHPVAEKIDKKEFPFGIILCGSGQGAAMTANKYPEVRAGLAWSLEQAQLMRQHNNANIISIPARFTEPEEAEKRIEIFLNTDFEGGRHSLRVNKIAKAK